MLHAHHGHVPNFGENSTHPEDFHVKPGATLIMEENNHYRHIYVDGTGDEKAIVRLTEGCKLWVQTILLNGRNARFESDEGISCEVIWRDLPLNTKNPTDYFDPEQLGNGLVNLSGEVYLRGKNPRSAKARLAKQIRSGDIFIELVDSPTNWQAGDVLCLTDTRQPSELSEAGAQTEFVTIKSISGKIIALVAQTRFSHLGIAKDDGTLRELPEIGNCTQSIVFRSENPNGVRGHMIHMDHCSIDMQGYVLKDMGRTTTAPLHSTIWDAHTGVVTQIGTNQIGRYVDHDHGMPGRDDAWQFQSYRSNFAIVGSPKLGLVKHHSSHFGLCVDFCIVDCAGCDITHETPNVYGNVYRRGFLCGKTPGSGLRATKRAKQNLAGGDHWHGGVGLGLQSMMAEFHDVSVYSRQDGLVMVGFSTTALWQPTKRGVHTDTSGSPRVQIIQKHRPDKEPEYPFHPTSNVTIWGCFRGVETWVANCFEDSARMFEGLKVIHCKHPTDLNDQNETYLKDWKILGDFSQIKPMEKSGDDNTFGVHFKPGYRFGINIVGGEISGYDCAYSFAQDDDYTNFIGVHINCPVVGYHMLGRYNKLKGADHFKWLNCTWGSSVEVLMSGWFPKYDLKQWLQIGRPDQMSLEPLTYEVSPWKDGRSYRVYHYEQHPDFEKPPIAADQAYGDWPPGVNTHKQLIERGTPIFGEVVPTTAFQRADFGLFWANQISIDPPPPLTVEERLDRIEKRLDLLEAKVSG